MKNLENICRVCLNRGSRNIFEKSSSTASQFTIPSLSDNVSSLDRLPEKLRYVTMLKIEECENLPKSMCDSCIIQLNVAYNLKKNAIQSDMKLRQYVIEYGIGVTSYTTCSINTVSVIHPTPMIMSAPNNSNVGSCSTASKSTSTVSEPKQFPVMPVVIKEEPIDYEIMSDITVETQSFDDQHSQCNRNSRTLTNFLRNNNKQQQQSLTPLSSNSMVAVNSQLLLLSTREASDNEYLSAYMPTRSTSSSQSTPTTSSKSTTDKPIESVPETSKTSSKATTQSSDSNAIKKKDSSKETNKKSKDNKTRGEQKCDVAERVTRQMNTSRESRTRGGSIAKKDYKSFYFIRGSDPTNLGKKTKRNTRGHASIDASDMRTSSARASTKKQRTFGPKMAINKKKLQFRNRSNLS